MQCCPRTYSTNACLTTHPFYPLDIQQGTSPVRDKNSHWVNARIFLILALPMRETPSGLTWCMKQSTVDVCLCRNERTQRKELLRLCGRKQRLVTANSFPFPDYAATVLLAVLGMVLRLHNHQQTAHMLKVVCRAGVWLWPAPRWWRAAPHGPSPCSTRHEHACEHAHQGSHRVTFKRNRPSFAVLV